jgi:hypothetical protein
MRRAAWKPDPRVPSEEPHPLAGQRLHRIRSQLAIRSALPLAICSCQTGPRAVPASMSARYSATAQSARLDRSAF